MLLEARKLDKSFNGVYALKGLDLSLKKGEIHGLVGENGAGKSTTMNMITGYIASTEGTVVIDGHDILEEPEEAKKCIGYLPEMPPLYFDMTVLEYLNTCTPDEYMRLWNRSAYIGDTGIGMEAVAEGGTVKLSGWKNPSVNMGQLDAKALAPDGYEMPAIEYYDRIFNGGWGMRFDRTDGYYTVQSPWEGRAHVYTLSGSRTDLFVGDVQLPELFHAEVYNKTNGVKDECVTFYGPGAQWGSGGVNHNKIVIACYSPENNGWFHAPGLRRQSIGKENSRIIRFIKSPVEYIY